jgi:hypothetical protein
MIPAPTKVDPRSALLRKIENNCWSDLVQKMFNRRKRRATDGNSCFQERDFEKNSVTAIE